MSNYAVSTVPADGLTPWQNTYKYNTGHLNIEAETKWPPFSDNILIFFQWKCVNFSYNFTEVCSSRPNKKYSSIGWNNGLVPTRRHTIIWTMMVSLPTHICVTQPQWVKEGNPWVIAGFHKIHVQLKFVCWSQWVKPCHQLLKYIFEVKLTFEILTVQGQQH